MKKKLKAAVWGIGSIGTSHVQALKELGVEVALIVSRNEEKLKKFAKENDIANYSTDEQAIMNADLDCVHICTPPNLHYIQMRELLKHGKNVLCEKPLCFEDHQAQELFMLAEENRCFNAVGFNVRFHDAVQQAKRMIASEDFGSVRLIHGSYLQEFHALPAPYDWRYDPKTAGVMRAMTEIGSHWTDLAEYLSGKKIKAVSACFANFEPKRDRKDGMMYELSSISDAEKIEVKSEDAALLHFRFEDGAIGSLVLSEVSQGRINRLEIEITGAKKNIWWNSEENNKLNLGEKGQAVKSLLYPFGNGFNDTLKRLFKNFYADIARGQFGDRPPYPTLLDGMRNVMICNAAYESAINQGKWIEI